MISIEEEIKASRKAASDIAKSDTDKEREEKVRAEMMARYAGGKHGPLDISTPAAPVKLWKTYRGKSVDADSTVFSGGQRPIDYFKERPDAINYTGIGKLTPYAENLEQMRSVLKVTDFSRQFKNDFISALYNGETPLAEYGVADINRKSRDIYARILGDNYRHVTGDNFRGYQLSPESLPFAAQLDDKVRKGDYTQKAMGYSTEGEEDWALKDKEHFYDAGGYQRVIVDHNGKKYYKLVDVFDTAGTSKLPIAKQINETISKHEKPFVVSTPWRELPENRK